MHNIREQMLAGPAAQQSFSFLEQAAQRRDGRRPLAAVSGGSRFSPEDEYQRMPAVTRDITERKRVEDELRNTKERLEAMVRNTRERLEAMISALPDLMFRVDREGCIHELHSSALDQLYVAPSLFLGKKVTDVLPADASRIIMAALDEAATRGSDHGSTYSLPRPQWISWYELSIAAMGDHLTRPRNDFIILIRDITERRQMEAKLRISEERHRLLADNATDVIWTMGLDGRFTYVSPSVEKLRGYTPAEAMQQSLDEVLTPGSLTISLEYIARNYANIQAAQPVEAFRGELEMRCKDGSTVWTEVTVSNIFDSAGNFVEMLGVTRDITERKQAERLLHDTMQALRVSSQAKSEFLANMSHEIRTPMNAVLGLAQLLEQEPLAPDQRDMVRRIRMAGRSLLGILNDILDFSKIEAGQLRIEAQPFTLAPLLEHLESLQGSLARDKGLTFRIEAPAGMTGSLVGDALRLEQILLNLIGNAIKFTAQGEIRVRVQPAALTETTARLRFEVRDTGVGIAPEVLASLFEPFTQADGSITRRFGGTGLGLSICKRLVDLMGGTIGADSTAGVGSVFWFELSFERATAVAPGPVPDALAVTSAGPRLAGRRILVVDDSDISRDLVARALQREGAATTLAGDGRQALAALRAAPQWFDAVLMDVQMPVLDGLSATRAIRSELGLTELPVIAFTAGVLEEERQRALTAGVNDFLPKPVDLEAMAALLLRWTTHSETADEVPVPEPAGADIAAISGFDAERVALTFGDDREFFLELLGMFCASFRDTAQQVRSDLATGDRDAAAHRLHALKGAAGNLGALELMHSAQALEQAIVHDRPHVEALLAQFATQLAELMQAAAPWLQQ